MDETLGPEGGSGLEIELMVSKFTSLMFLKKARQELAANCFLP